ncbi:PEP-CTERM sorting domain-containing protein [Denitrobaculum tricleocarpae]|nr:PEP-CTERM sorting domain-containing protein [Denitrobaculum tricleocarpae]
MRLKILFTVIAIGLSTVSWSRSASATVMTYDMSWTGDGGYSMTGMFSFDDSTLAASPLVQFPDLLSFEATAFKPDGTALETYAFSTSDYSIFSTKNFIINFNFEADTGLLRQDGSGGLLSPFNLFFGAFTAGEIQPTGWFLYEGASCNFFFKTVLDATSPECSTRWDASDESLVQVRLRGGLQNEVQVPEPGTLAVFGLGLTGLGFAARRKRR